MFDGESFNMCKVGSEILAFKSRAGNLEGNHERKH
jgi:hypothetical protein